MSLISRLKAVVAGDEYLDDDFDELDYASADETNDINDLKQNQRNSKVEKYFIKRFDDYQSQRTKL